MQEFPSDEDLDREISERWKRFHERGSIFANTEPIVQATLLNVLSERRLEIAIDRFNTESGRQTQRVVALTRRIELLTWVLVGIGLVQLVAVVVQVAVLLGWWPSA